MTKAISIHAPHEGERQMGITDEFNTLDISIHAPHEGERLVISSNSATPMPFQSTLPTRGSDADIRTGGVASFQFQSTLPTRGSDLRPARCWQRCCNFNPRSPRGGATLHGVVPPSAFVFQSTLPTRGSDEFMIGRQGSMESISIHAPHEGERRVRRNDSPAERQISIHAPHEGERPTRSTPVGVSFTFQSTLPTRGSDVYGGMVSVMSSNFNPRSPRGGATAMRSSSSPTSEFQSTLPTRGSDGARHRHRCRVGISIHAPHEGERRCRRSCTSPCTPYFNPRSPRGGATPADQQGVRLY